MHLEYFYSNCICSIHANKTSESRKNHPDIFFDKHLKIQTHFQLFSRNPQNIY